jgi:pimeloyl-ACP methyl ester carboxylesterase
LSERAQLVAIDLPGFGKSEARADHSLGLAEDAGDAAMWTTLAASWLTEQTSRASSALHAA